MKKLIGFYLLLVSVGFIEATHPLIPVKSDTALIKAVKEGDHKTIKTLLKNKCIKINEFGIDYKTALDIAVEFDDAKTAILLSKYGAKMTRADNVQQFKSMLAYRGKRLLYSFVAMFIFSGIAFWALNYCVCLVNHVSEAYLALAIPVCVGVIVYAGFQWSRLFMGISMFSKVEKNWMIQIPDNLA
ncbi:ankyrin repeat domain-containing protein [Candidatus Dependentiae bacterium]|nr:ankyrin repeat domain-containing protein [Candidatus Dependentiae bacterium]